MASRFETRALEMHGDAMWSDERVTEALDLMQELELNTLVFHYSDLLNLIVFPREYFGAFSQWTSAPPRRGENAIYNAREYIRHVSQKTRAREIDFFIEIKELAVCDEFLEMSPEMLVDGVVCPSHPKWIEFINARYTELCTDFPDIDGVILSVGSPEGRVTLAARRCGCRRCRDLEPEDWYRDIAGAVHEVLSKYGRRLVIREFSYGPADQAAVVRSIESLPADVEICIKPYARDFYPTYPDNGVLGTIDSRPRWLEYDVHGQYFGWGVFPCPIAEDLARRLAVARKAGVRNLTMRTDWERVNDLTSLRTFNRVNIVTGAALAVDETLTPSAGLLRAARLCGVISPDASDEQAEEMADALLRLWPILAKSLYVRGFVFNHSSMLPRGVAHGWWHMARQHNLAAWVPEAAERIDVRDPSVTGEMLSEKDSAVSELAQLIPALEGWTEAGLLSIPDPCHLGDVYGWMDLYIAAFSCCAKLTILSTAASDRDGGLTEAEVAELRAECEKAEEIAGRCERFARPEASHHVGLLSGAAEVRATAKDARAALRGHEG